MFGNRLMLLDQWALQNWLPHRMDAICFQNSSKNIFILYLFLRQNLAIFNYSESVLGHFRQLYLGLKNLRWKMDAFFSQSCHQNSNVF